MKYTTGLEKRDFKITKSSLQVIFIFSTIKKIFRFMVCLSIKGKFIQKCKVCHHLLNHHYSNNCIIAFMQ